MSPQRATACKQRSELPGLVYVEEYGLACTAPAPCNPSRDNKTGYIMDLTHTLSRQSATQSFLQSHKKTARCSSTRGSFRSASASVWRKFSSTTVALSMDDNGGTTYVGVPTGANPKLWFALIYSTFTLAGCHFVCGFVSIGVGKEKVKLLHWGKLLYKLQSSVGAITTIIAEHTIYAHTVFPILSGFSVRDSDGFC